MTKPSMVAEIINVPETPEELAIAQAKAKETNEAIEEAGRKLREGGNGIAPTPTEMVVEERISNASHAVLTAMWEYAAATGNTSHHINSILFTAAVVVANAESHAEEVRILEYISKTAAGLRNKAKMEVAGQTNPTKGH